ncbi:helix-turn-helix domain-containing protein [Flavobacterium sp. T12S277]|uniref:helix-turn-helix domain-containing protein n=1 Tax=Flavobacterium sp. T12S277 TaxID=3402752 RepID=UPI003AECE021
MNALVGNKLKKLRKSRNFSQEEMADYLNISQSSYARMENGENHSWANHISRICEIFTIYPEDLIRRDLLDGNNNQQKLNSTYSVQELSDKLIEQYEQRINELKEIIEIYKDKKK